MTFITPTLPAPRMPRQAVLRPPETGPGAPPDLTRPQTTGWEPGAFKPRSDGRDAGAGARPGDRTEPEGRDDGGPDETRSDDAVMARADRAAMPAGRAAGGEDAAPSQTRPASAAELGLTGGMADAPEPGSADRASTDRAAALRDEARNGYLLARLVSMAAPDPVTMSRAA